jgi:hypothetical protein
MSSLPTRPLSIALAALLLAGPMLLLPPPAAATALAPAWKLSPATSGTNVTSVSLLVSSTSVPEWGEVYLTPVPVCFPAPCPAPYGIDYRWNLTNHLTGDLIAGFPANASFTGFAPGTVGVFVNASLGMSKATAWVILTVLSEEEKVTSLTLAPTSASLEGSFAQGTFVGSNGGTAVFTATSTCAPLPCPQEDGYQWSLTAIGGLTDSILNATRGSSVTFQAGASPGAVTVVVRLNVGTSTATANATVTVHSAVWFLEEPALAIEVSVVAVLVAAIVVLYVVGKRRGLRRGAPPSTTEPTQAASPEGAAGAGPAGPGAYPPRP